MKELTEKQLDLVIKNALAGIATDVVVALVTAAALWNQTRSLFLPIWLLALCLGVWARIVFVRRYQGTSSPKKCLWRRQASYSLVSVYTGATWGSLGLFSTLNLSLGYQLLVTFLLLCLAVRALAIKGAFLPAYLDFLLPMSLLLVLGFLMQADSTGTLMAILIGIITGAFYQCSRRVNRIVVSAIRLSAEKDVLVSQLMTALEDERKRIAAELHDGIGQSLSAIKYGLESEVTKLSQSQIHGGTLHFEAVTQGMQEAIGELRRIAMGLRPAMLDDLGILSTLDWFCRTYHSAHPQINVAKRYALGESDVPQELKVTIYRIVQEAFNNIAKHAGADQVTFELEKTTMAIRLLIKDNGQGFDVPERGNPGIRTVFGFGLISMRERAESTAGEFNLTSGIGSGTTVEICWPLATLGDLLNG
ncbi:MAG: sensor histidine kinase [Gammaproteobacteria bacterium]